MWAHSKKMSSINQEEKLHWELNLLKSWSWTSNCQNCEATMFFLCTLHIFLCFVVLTRANQNIQSFQKWDLEARAWLRIVQWLHYQSLNQEFEIQDWCTKLGIPITPLTPTLRAKTIFLGLPGFQSKWENARYRFRQNPCLMETESERGGHQMSSSVLYVHTQAHAPPHKCAHTHIYTKNCHFFVKNVHYQKKPLSFLSTLKFFSSC